MRTIIVEMNREIVDATEPSSCEGISSYTSDPTSEEEERFFAFSAWKRLENYVFLKWSLIHMITYR